ncbi:MAG: ATP-binding protein [Pseudomonadota bacterium]
MKSLPREQPRPTAVRVLLVEDDDDHAELIEAECDEAPLAISVVRAVSLETAGAALETSSFDAVFLDLGLPGSFGLETLERCLAYSHTCPIIVMTAAVSWELGLDAVRLGAQDFLPKGELGAAAITRAILFGIERKRSFFELERRNRLLETFAASAGHDLVSPARQIGFLADLLAEDAADRLSASDKERLADIGARAAHLRQVLRDTMAFAKLGMRVASKECVPLSVLIGQVLRELPAEDRMRVSLGNDAKLRVDPSLGYLILKNLVLNGLKYWRDCPSVVTISAARRGSAAHLAIADNGAGIALDQLERVFMPGFRAENDPRIKGTGFGLAICRELVSAHEGQIWATSELGKGTTIHIIFPD